MPKMKPREIRFAEIEGGWKLASYFWFDGRFCPAVWEKNGRYNVRVVKSETVSGLSRNMTFDEFVIDFDGTVLVAPRGYAKDYKPGRVVDIADAVVRYSTPDDSTFAMRL